MPHIRKRHLIEVYKKMVGYAPITGLFGHRQVGKTTFLESVAGTYHTLDRETTLQQIEDAPERFIAQKGSRPIIIDESQYAPRLFPALKEWERTHKAPGQFVLSGSVRFSSRRAIRESLTGRITAIELFPLTIAELDQRPLPELLPALHRLDRFLAPPSIPILGAAQSKSIDQYLSKGGLPRLCFARDNKLREEGLEELHRTILDRDLRLVLETKLSLVTLGRFLRQIALKGYHGLNYQEIRRELGLAPQTQKALLYALESIYLIRRVPFREGAGERILMEDQFEEHFLSQNALDADTQLSTLVYRNVRAQYDYRAGARMRVESYRTRGGADIPWILNYEGKELALLISRGAEPSLSQIRSADSFFRISSNAKALFLCRAAKAAQRRNDRSLVIPLSWIL